MPPAALVQSASSSSPTPEPSRLERGFRVGADLEITGILGVGGTATVYSAEHAILGREVAVKFCTVRGPYMAEAQMRLIREAKMCASVRDERVPRIYGLDALEDGTPYLVMEKVEGEALTRLLTRWRVPVRYACALVCTLLDTLVSVHLAGVVHRDVKPSNLLVDLRPDAIRPMRLIDFGVGKTLANGPDDPGLTLNGAVVGTPHYMAPEQVAGRADARSDLYAAGIVLYELLAGRTPFAGKSVVEVLAAVLCDPIPPLRTLRPGLPESLFVVVEKATERDASKRYHSAPEMRLALADATQDVIGMGFLPAFEAMAKPDFEPGPTPRTSGVVSWFESSAPPTRIGLR